MRVRVHAADEGGCGWYRMRFPAKACRDAGLDVELRDDVPGWIREQGSLTEIAAIDPAYDADVAVFQRPLRRQILETMGRLQERGVAVVIDMDDDFHALPVGHQARRDTSGRANPDANRLWLRRACARADLVTVSTPALAERYGGHGRCVVLRNCVPERYLKVGERERRRHSDGPVVVGWTGSTATHVGDLDVTGGGVGQAVRETGARFHVVGTGVGVANGLGLHEEPTTTGWVPFDRYAAEYARLDVAVVPLADNPFNHAKSWLKGLEAAALGVPFVASPVAEYRRLHLVERAGVLADGTWASKVAALCVNDAWRAEAADQGRLTASRWTYEGRWGDWATAWAEALANAHRRRKKTVA